MQSAEQASALEVFYPTTNPATAVITTMPTRMSDSSLPTFDSALTIAAERIRASANRLTRPRQTILASLLASGSALTHDELEHGLRQAGEPIDRVTIYRVLEWLVEHHFAHRVATEARAWRFSAILEEGSDHGHFECRDCERVFCLSETEPGLQVHVPNGFRVEESELMVRGRCPDCNEAEAARRAKIKR